VTHRRFEQSKFALIAYGQNERDVGNSARHRPTGDLSGVEQSETVAQQRRTRKTESETETQHRVRFIAGCREVVNDKEPTEGHERTELFNVQIFTMKKTHTRV